MVVELAWRPSRVGGGGGINAGYVSPHDHDHVAVVGDISGPQVSTDGGRSWLGGRGGMPDAAASSWSNLSCVTGSPDAGRPNRRWAGGPIGLLVSNDRGRTWSLATGVPSFDQGSQSSRPRLTGRRIVEDAAGRVFMGDSAGRVFRYSGYNANGLSGALVELADLGSAAVTCVEVNPVTTTQLVVALRAGGMRRILGVTGAGPYTVGTYTNAPSRVDQIKLVDEAGTPRIYAACDSSGIRRADASSLSSAFSDIGPANSGALAHAVDGYRSGSITVIDVGYHDGALGGTDSTGKAWYKQIARSVNAQAGSPSWTWGTANDAAVAFVNESGGPGGLPYFGYLAAGQGGPAGNKLVRDPSYSPEQIVSDPDGSRTWSFGTGGVYLIDWTGKRARPMMDRLGVTTWGPCAIDPNDSDNAVAGNNDHWHFVNSNGDAGRWLKNEQLPAGYAVGAGGKSRGTAVAYLDDGGTSRLLLGYGEQGSNAFGELFYQDDVTSIAVPKPLGLKASTGAKRVIAVAGRKIGSNYHVIACVQESGAWKRVFTARSGGTLTGGSWSKVSTGAMFATASGFGPGTARMGSIVIQGDDKAFAIDRLSGLWRSLDFSTTCSWQRVWTFSHNDERSGHVTGHTGAPNTILVAIPPGAYLITNAHDGTIDAGSGTITRTEIRPGGSSVRAPAGVKAWGNGKWDVIDHENPRAYWRTEDSGATWTDVSDDVFRTTAYKISDLDVAPDGTALVATTGPGLVWGSPTTAPPPPPPPPPPEPEPGDSTIAETELVRFTSSANLTTYNAGDALAPMPADTPALAFVVSSDLDGAAPTPSGVTGFGLTWSLEDEATFLDTSGRAHRLSAWSAPGISSPTAAGIEVTFGDDQAGCAVWAGALDRAGTPAQADSATWGSSPSVPALALASDLGGNGQHAVYAAVIMPANPPGITPEQSGEWVALEIGYTNPILGLHVARDLATLDKTYGPSVSPNRWAGVILEIPLAGTALDVFVGITGLVGTATAAQLESVVGITGRVAETGAIVLTAGASDTDAGSVTTASIDPAATDLILAAIETTRDGNDPSIPELVGNGLTWVPVASIVYATGAIRRRLTLFSADPGSTDPPAGTVVIRMPEV